MPEKNHVIVVGAGLSGLIAATRLSAANVDVTVFDKGRGVGGRTASRRFEGARFDHGAQYFTVRDERFQTWVDQWLAAGVVKEWARGFPAVNGFGSEGKYPRYIGVNGMTSMAKALAAPLNVHVNAQVTQITAQDNGWQIQVYDTNTKQTATHHADALLMTPPGPQSLTLLTSSNVDLPEKVTQALEAIRYSPCFALMALLDRPTNVPAPGGIFMHGDPLSWIADNQQKGISEQPALTIHAGPRFTLDHYDDDHDHVASLLIDAAADYIGDANVVSYQVQRWRYSQPTNLHPQKTLFTRQPAPLAFAGDSFGGARVEGAVLSGQAAADQLLVHLIE